MTDHNTYYKRQISLNEVGATGQEKLKESKVLVIGAGGLGSPLLTYLAAAGVGNITIYDNDLVDETNLHRQILFDPTDIGKIKSIIAKEKLSKKNPLVKIEAFTAPFDETASIDSYDIIVDCTDNLKTKFLAHDMSFQKNKVFCMASIHKFEGQIQFFNYKQRDKDSPCLRCLWKKRPSDDSIQSCAEAGVIGATAGVIGTIQASEVIKYILGLNYLSNNENLLINLIDFSSFKIKLSKNIDCPLCGNNPKEISDYKEDFEIDSKSLIDSSYLIVNLTDQKLSFENCIHSSLEAIITDLKDQRKDKEIAVICMRGITSIKAVKALRDKGHYNSYSVIGGLNELRKKEDS